MPSTRTAAALWVALIGAGCGSDPFRPDTDLTVGLDDVTAIETDDTATADVLLISDTHASNPLAPHALLSDGFLADTYVTEVAIRPPHLDHWGSRLLDWVLERPRPARTIIHLGDAGNIGCLGEMARFTASMNRRPDGGDARPWYMAPGNHDSLVLGNWGYIASDPDVRTAWNRECSGTGSMDKHGFLDAYLQAKGWDEVPESEPAGDGYTCHDVITHDANATAVVCRRPPAYEYESFIVQLIAINPDVVMVLLDTTGFRELPSLTHLGGKTGGIGERQIAEIRRLLEGSGGKRVILAGHHPSTWLDSASRADLAQLIHDFPVVAHLSGHTHNATNARLHDTATEDNRKFLELNVGSLLDWPMEYGYLSARPIPDSDDGIDLTLTIEASSMQLEDRCLERWGATRVPEGEPGYYTSYIKNGRVTYDALRAQMFERLRADLAVHDVRIPADYARHELESGATPSELIADAVAAQTVTDYERCQAIWASEAESHAELSPWNARLLSPNHWLQSPPSFAGGDELRAAKEAVASHRWLIRRRETGDSTLP